MIRLTTSLWFAGDCEAAFKFYERCLGGKIAHMLRWGESPMAEQAPAGWGDKLLYARLTVGESELLGGDVPPNDARPARGFAVMLGISGIPEAERVFGELAAGGAVRMALQETFWAVRYGNVVDRFGVPWEINCDKPH